MTATVLSGDLLGDDIGSVSGGNTLRGDNAFTVVTVPAGAVDVVLDGVTIVGGQANGYADSGEFRDRAADRLDPQISGGGVQCLGQATLRRVDLRGNLAAFGGAMAANGDCAVLDSRITGNRSRGPNISVTLYGGGVFQAGGALRIEDTEIVDNNGDLPGFSGGGVAILDGTLDVDGAVFRDNRTGGDTSRGGGLCAIGGRVRVGSSVFRDNEGVRGAAIFAGRGPGGTAGQVIAEQILVHDNDSSEGGALHAAGGPRGATQVVLRISYATVADNTVAVQGDRSAVVLLQNSIVFGNAQDLDDDTSRAVGGRFDVLFTLLRGFEFGDGNISSTDPGFVSRQLRDYRLTAASPAVDAGNRLLDTDGFLEGLQVPELDFAGLPRLVDGDGDGELEVDMGAFELPGSGG